MKAGYTLVELLVVLAIMGFVAVAVTPMLTTSYPNIRAKAAARAVAADLIAARQAAIARGAVTPVRLATMAARHGSKDVHLVFRSAVRDEIDFYPDGSSNGGTILISDGNASHRVTVRWPAGQIDVDE